MTKKVRALIVAGGVAGLLGLGAGLSPMAIGADCPAQAEDREYVDGSDSGVYTAGDPGTNGAIGVDGETPDGQGGYIEANGSATEQSGHIVLAGSDGTGYAVADGGAGACGGE